MTAPITSADQAKWALVTGATGGLGRAFCDSLARRGYHLALSARNGAQLQELAADLSARYGIETVVETADLGVAGSGAALKAALDDRGIRIETLVNNAGYAVHGRFIDRPCASELDMIDVNIRALTELTHVFAADMAVRGGGHILLVASSAAFQPIPGYAAYAASKAYVLSLGHALNLELKRRNVVVSVTCPGPTETGFWKRAGHAVSGLVGSLMMTPDVVAETGLKAMFAGKPHVVTGLANKVSAFSARLFPRPLLALAASRLMRDRK